MSLAALLDKPVTLVYLSSQTDDQYGHPVVGETEVEAACYYRLVSTDDQDALSRQQIDYTVYLPITLNLEGMRVVLINGERYELQGPAHRQWNPRLMRDEFWVLSVRRAV